MGHAIITLCSTRAASGVFRAYAGNMAGDIHLDSYVSLAAQVICP